MKLYKTRKGNILVDKGNYFLIDQPWDELINREGLHDYLLAVIPGLRALSPGEAAAWCESEALPTIGTQEVWAAGVTYLRSRDARMEESKDSGGADFYDKVYAAERPELFFKSLSHRVAGHGQAVYIRRDSAWNVPEPELALYINSKGNIQGYTIGNDMSSRSIEGENPLYLPQAKVYERSAALGPCLYIPREPLALSTGIHMSISRAGNEVYSGSVEVGRMKRSFTELAEYLYREMDFIPGCYLMTGTCLVPPNEFTLAEGDRVEIRIDGIGMMVNIVSYASNELGAAI
jgi:2-dehydro-3-deoxy-D-arabinonate dehydratase